MIASAPKLDRRIESVLKSLTNTRSLKDLFYDRLHYDRVSEPISNSRFPDLVQASLGDSEPLLLANGGDLYTVEFPADLQAAIAEDY
jgi:hypothetical protein